MSKLHNWESLPNRHIYHGCCHGCTSQLDCRGCCFYCGVIARKYPDWSLPSLNPAVGNGTYKGSQAADTMSIRSASSTCSFVAVPGSVSSSVAVNNKITISKNGMTVQVYTPNFKQKQTQDVQEFLKQKRYCSNCGATSKHNEIHCSYCGRLLPGEIEHPPAYAESDYLIKHSDPKWYKLLNTWYWPFIRSFVIVAFLPLHSFWLLPAAIVLNFLAYLFEEKFKKKYKKSKKSKKEKEPEGKPLDYFNDLFFNNVDEFKKEHEKIDEALNNLNNSNKNQTF